MPAANKHLFARSFFALFATGGVILLCSWGIWGHQHINRAAIFALPEEMRVFYYNHIDVLTEESVGPDYRKYALNFKSEGPRHFIDVEAFERPIDSLPRLPKEASKTYEENFLTKNGSLPWYIQEIMAKLTKAMQDRKKTDILLLSADLGHYIGDSQMPLHTSINYDGQLTDQKGIHAFFESQLPEEFGHNYNLYTGDPIYIDNIPEETFRLIRSSHALVDTLLAIERNLRASVEEGKIYKTDDKGKPVKNSYGQNVHSHEYARKYHEALNGMVEKQIRAAIAATANFWYTAWVNAGKPDLNSLDDAELTKDNHEFYLKDLAAWKKGKVTKLKVSSEF